MNSVYIVAARRTAGGRRNGRLAGMRPAELAARILDALVDDAGIDPAAIDDVIMGCVTQAGEQANQVGRYAVLSSKLPISVPAVTIDRQCGSSQQAIHFGAQAIMAGTSNLVIAAGVESMTRVPMGANVRALESATPMTAAIRDRFGVDSFSQFSGAEAIAKKWGFTREDLDAYGLESHRRAVAATRAGAFATEILPVEIVSAEGARDVHETDEGIRYDASMESMASVKLLVEGGVITAATSSQITDGASGVLLASDLAVKEHGLTPLARIVSLTVTAGDPVIMLEEPLFATDKALERAGLSIDDIDLFEVNEAFAPIPMAWQRHTGADPARLNASGGAIALGHPLGATGTKLMTTLVHALRAGNKKLGLQTMCEGGGTANVTIVEAL